MMHKGSTPGFARRRGAPLTALLGAVAVLGGALLSACDSGVERRPQTARPAENTHQDFGDFEVHFNAVRTDELGPDMARAYGIERSSSRVLLNVALLAKAADGRTTPVDGTVRASARNLNGQLKNLQMRRVQDSSVVSFIGEVAISGNEILVFDIDAKPLDGSGAYSVQFKREFFAD
jgi:hypothetical protein